jgi:hypothetical protein
MKWLGPPWFIVVMIASLVPDVAFGCSCMGTRSIGASMATADAVVVAKVERFEFHEWDTERRFPERAIARVSGVLKGKVAAEIPISGSNMCYQSLPIDNMSVGQSYLLPLYRIEPKVAPEGVISLDPAYDVSPTDPPLYILPECAESALLVERDNLFTAEPIPGGSRKWRYHSSLKLVESFASVGLWNVRMIFAFAFAVVVAGTIGMVICRRWPLDRLRRVAIVVTWLALAFLIDSMLDAYQFNPEWFRIMSLWPIALIGVMLIAHHVKPGRAWSLWSGIAASVVWGGFGLFVYSEMVFYSRSMFVEDMELAVVTIVPCVVGLFSLIRRRHEPRQTARVEG